MRTTVTLLVAAAAAVSGLHYYRTNRTPAVTLAGPAEGAPAAGGAAVPAPGAPARAREPGGGPHGRESRGIAAEPARGPADRPGPAAAAPAPPLAGPGGAEVELHREGLAALAAGEATDAALLLFRAAREMPDGPARADAVARLRRLEDAEAARARAIEASDPAGARAAFTAAYLACLSPERRAPYRAALDRLTATVVFSRRDFPHDAVFHVVQKGDSLKRIAGRYGFPVEGIQRVNGLRGTSIRIGENLKIPRGPVEVLVVKNEFRLVLLFDGRFVKEYAIGTGRESSTPEAVFEVEEKIAEPTWYSREGAFPFGHPKNILGTRWLGFRNTDQHRGFGIHGTTLPDSIGREESSGCIRMRNEDVEELFGLVPRGARVTITR